MIEHPSMETCDAVCQPFLVPCHVLPWNEIVVPLQHHFCDEEQTALNRGKNQIKFTQFPTCRLSTH